MPKATVSGAYNGLEAEEKPRDDRPVDEFGQALNKDGSVSKIQPLSEADKLAAKEESSAGSSSLTSGSRPGGNGETTTTGPQLPAPDAPNLSEPAQPAPPESPAESSSAQTTDGSTQGTGSGPASPQASSEDDTQLLDSDGSKRKPKRGST
jgi:hypothetical protein